MSGETLVTIIGRLTKEPELKFIGNSAVAEFSVAVNARKFNKQTNEWENKPTKFWDCAAWNAGKQTLADNVVEVLRKGSSVVVHGELETREWEDRDGKRRSADQIRVISVGKDLTWHQGNSAHQASGNTQQPAQSQGWGGQQAPADDPWGAPSGGGWGSAPAQDPPF
ncbi:single-stranded DNA-binding protein [Arthrobacter luteolus]|uniref:single-stranded DNA-binding protein n=1 Tax=Arthrobacter luteolus TaxID=98672 RepID=UPI0008297F40|nr:single-stranded DNA-binding protein [Arthrobacter luteolus]